MSNLHPSESANTLEHAALKELLTCNLEEKRRNRRWRIFFQLCWFFLIATISYCLLSKNTNTANNAKHTALINFSGIIESEGHTNAENIISSLQAAFTDTNSVAVILRMNSPGGSAVQSAMISDEILRLRKLHPKKQIYSVVEEICASGCYFAAVATNEIYVNRSSIVGSIGVLSDAGFALDGVIKHFGIERRLYASGPNKVMQDPFLSQTSEQKEHIQKMINAAYEEFKSVVLAGRGKKLQQENIADIFSGSAWNGSRGIELGLADGVGSVESVAREMIKNENIIDYSQREGFIERFARKIGIILSSAMSQSLRGIAALY